MTAFVAHVPNLSDATLVRENPVSTLVCKVLRSSYVRECTHGQCSLHSLHQRHGFFYVIDQSSKSQVKASAVSSYAVMCSTFS